VNEAYLDACCFIYLVEGALAWRAAVEHRIRGLPTTMGLVTSRLSRLECRSKPLRDRDALLLDRYEALFGNTRVVEVSATIVETATELRSRYGFRSPDSIHLATAIEARADVFLTGDALLARCAEIRVSVLIPTP
jgi:predicted nucleic acid-binding protein